MNLKNVDIRKVYRNWKNNSNEFECFMKSGPFVSLQTYKDFELEDYSQVSMQKYENIIQDILGCEENDFIVCDFNFNKDVELGVILNNTYSIKPILCFNMLFHEYGIIGTKENIASLVNFGMSLKNIVPKGYVFLFDYDRFKNFEKSEYKKRLNNQYEICDADIPFFETLNMLGYTKTVLYTQKETKADIQSYLNYLKKSGMEVKTKFY